jgi:SAM-dependent methyltransferase
MGVKADRHAHGHREAWERKPALRALYNDFYARLLGACPQGRILEIGAGTNHRCDLGPGVVRLDVREGPGIDVVADAHALPFAKNAFDAMIMIDVLHHLQFPLKFMHGAAEVLRPGGRISMVEPGMSPWSRHFYGRFHHEPLDLAANAFAPEHSQSGADPWDSNQALPTLLFATPEARRKLAEQVPDLRVVKVEWLSILAYPLSGGFRRWRLIPNCLLRPLLWAENGPLRRLAPWLGFRLHVTLEKS